MQAVAQVPYGPLHLDHRRRITHAIQNRIGARQLLLGQHDILAQPVEHGEIPAVARNRRIDRLVVIGSQGRLGTRQGLPCLIQPDGGRIGLVDGGRQPVGKIATLRHQVGLDPFVIRLLEDDPALGAVGLALRQRRLLLRDQPVELVVLVRHFQRADDRRLRPQALARQLQRPGDGHLALRRCLRELLFRLPHGCRIGAGGIADRIAQAGDQVLAVIQRLDAVLCRDRRLGQAVGEQDRIGRRRFERRPGLCLTLGIFELLAQLPLLRRRAQEVLVRAHRFAEEITAQLQLFVRHVRRRVRGVIRRILDDSGIPPGLVEFGLDRLAAIRRLHRRGYGRYRCLREAGNAGGERSGRQPEGEQRNCRQPPHARLRCRVVQIRGPGEASSLHGAIAARRQAREYGMSDLNLPPAG